jgi:hypothetical protein
MIRMILIALVVGLTVLCGASIALYQYFGWKGLIAVPFLVVALIWIVKKVIGMVFKKFAMGLFGMKSGVLKGATMKVHSVSAVDKPIEPEPVPELEDAEDAVIDVEGEAVRDDAMRDEDVEEEAENEEEADADEEEEEGPKVYYEVDMTITPSESAGDHVWEPGEFILSSDKISGLADLMEKEVGTVNTVKVWDGTAFGPDDPGKYPGEQRLLVTFEVKEGVRNAWVNYYNEPLGTLELPEAKPKEGIQVVG